MKLLRKTILPILIAAIILLGSSYGCGLISAIIGMNRVPSYSQRAYVAPDEKTISSNIEKVLEIAETPDQQTKLTVARASVLNDYYSVLTSFTVASIEYNKDVTNTANKERYEYISKYANTLQNSVLEMEKTLCLSSYKDFLASQLGQDYIDRMLDYDVKSEELLALEARETELESRYSAEVPAGNGENLAAIYKELITVRNQISSLYTDADGKPYENYMDYAYAEIYGRDYTPDDAKALREAVVTYVKPVMQRLKDSSFTRTSPRTDEASLKKYASAIIAETSTEIHSSWQYMMKYNLYDFTQSENKANTSYVTEFYQYGDGFMFINPSGVFTDDLNTILHEFGHYNAIFGEDESKAGNGNIYNYDLLETHSQGFELISLPAVKKAFERYGSGEYYNSYAYYLVYSSLSAMLYQSLIDSFEYEVYSAQADLLSEEFFNKTFEEACDTYWFSNAGGNYYSIPHLFQAPAYCISYAVSMVFASEIWMAADPVNTYLNVVSYGAGHYLSEVYMPTGLANPLLPETIETITAKYSDFVSTIIG